MIISSWNVNSVRARIENIKEYLKKYSPDILMMQEIKAQDENYPYEDFEKSNYQNYVFGQKSYNGVAIISKKKLDKIEIKNTDQSTCLIQHTTYQILHGKRIHLIFILLL